MTCSEIRSFSGSGVLVLLVVRVTRVSCVGCRVSDEGLGGQGSCYRKLSAGPGVLIGLAAGGGGTVNSCSKVTTADLSLDGSPSFNRFT